MTEYSGFNERKRLLARLTTGSLSERLSQLEPDGAGAFTREVFQQLATGAFDFRHLDRLTLGQFLEMAEQLEAEPC